MTERERESCPDQPVAPPHLVLRPGINQLVVIERERQREGWTKESLDAKSPGRQKELCLLSFYDLSRFPWADRHTGRHRNVPQTHRLSDTVRWQYQPLFGWTDTVSHDIRHPLCLITVCLSVCLNQPVLFCGIIPSILDILDIRSIVKEHGAPLVSIVLWQGFPSEASVGKHWIPAWVEFKSPFLNQRMSYSCTFFLINDSVFQEVHRFIVDCNRVCVPNVPDNPIKHDRILTCVECTVGKERGVASPSQKNLQCVSTDWGERASVDLTPLIQLSPISLSDLSCDSPTPWPLTLAFLSQKE